MYWTVHYIVHCSKRLLHAFLGVSSLNSDRHWRSFFVWITRSRDKTSGSGVAEADGSHPPLRQRILPEATSSFLHHTCLTFGSRSQKRSLRQAWMKSVTLTALVNSTKPPS